MIQCRSLSSALPLQKLKELYILQATAPLDGMWLCGFVPAAKHFGFYDDEKLVGFFCVNDDGYLLQFFLDSGYENLASQLFASVVQGSEPPGKVSGAFVSTAEPSFLSLCADHFPSFDVNALMYQLGVTTDASDASRTDHPALAAFTAEELPQAVQFAVDNIGAPEDWLTGYYTNLIQRQELFGLRENGQLLAVGESRGYDALQTGFADLGVIVAQAARGRGLATDVLKQLVTRNVANELKSICSTEKANAAAQKAIVRAGFTARNRILRFDA